jgi:HD-GYP domain-containing protein (c-di-GMP phosphodiesterase class II)
MASPKQNRASSDQAQQARPAADDPVLAALRQAEAHYRQLRAQLDQRSADLERDLARARDESESLRHRLAAQELAVERERHLAQQQRESAHSLASALKEVHRALFSGNVYDLILKTCLTLTGGTRGLYITAGGQHAPLRVRSAIEVAEHPSSPPSRFIAALCRTVLEQERVFLCNDPGPLPEQPEEGEAFRNCVVAPVVLRANLNGVVIVADKAGGDFDQRDADLLLSIGNHAAVAVENAHLQREVQEAYLSIVGVLAEAMAARNPQVQRHQESVCHYARVVAERLGLSEYERSVAYYAALLHDIGNIGVSDGVLNKPGPLLDAERELIRAHVQIGYDLLCNVPLLESVAEVVRHHHERYDGSGYPDGLQGEAIPLAARVVSVVDAYGAMLAPRSYRPALTVEQARRELRRGAGTQFDPKVVEHFLAAIDAPEQRELEDDLESSRLRLPGLSLKGDASSGR